ncbi:MAG: portal protein [Geminicoccaceae bacterium]
MAEEDVLKEAKEAFELASNYEQENRNLAEQDLRFARLGDQWDEEVLRQRKEEGRPALTINKMPAFIRQVVNETRQNKPQIKARPVDGGADVDTAHVINGLIRNIEVTSDADVAYDTAVDFAASMGFGYFRVDVDYSHDDTFDQDIRIERIPNPFNVFGDPYSEAHDSSDWNTAFLVKQISKDEFRRRYKSAEEVDWDETGYTKLDQVWFDGEEIMLAEYWTRAEVPRTILKLSNGLVVASDLYEEQKPDFDVQRLTVEGERVVQGHRVTHRLLTGAEVLEETDWPGKYIPIVPVYGEEVNVEGRRYFRSLIRDASDAQRMFNYWRTASTELVALAPKAPFVGPEDAFTGQDSHKWGSANTKSYAFLAYAGDVAPERQPFAGVPAGTLQEALNASDDMKAVLGIFDASLGARSNETSGRAIVARQKEGDTSTFHFPDNLTRAIRHGGRVVIDLIPYVYTGERIIRTLGQDDTSEDVALGQGEPPEGFENIYDLTVGKYDLVVDEGPSYATQRQEAAAQMFDLLQVFPQAAPVIGDLLVKNLDWPGADEISERLRALVPGQDQEDPRLGQAMQVIQQLQGQIQEMEEDRALERAELEIKAMKARSEAQNDVAKNEIAAMEAQLKAAVDERNTRLARDEAATKAYQAETQRISALAKAKKDITDAASPPGPADKRAA